MRASNTILFLAIGLPMLSMGACAGSEAGVLAPAEPASSASAVSVSTAPGAPYVPPTPRPATSATQAAEGEKPPVHRDIPLDVASIPGAAKILQSTSIGANELRDALLGALRPSEEPGFYVPYGAAREFRASSAKPKLIAEWIVMLKAVVRSPSFREVWEQARDEAAWMPPVEDPPKPRSAREIRDESVASLDKQIGGLNESLAQPSQTPEARRELEGARNVLKKQRAELFTGNGADETARVEQQHYEQQRQQRPELERQRREEMKRRALEWPASPMMAAKNKLDLLDTTIKTMPWNTALITQYGRRFFVDAELEAKPAYWKVIFRAGKTVGDETRKQIEKLKKELDEP